MSLIHSLFGNLVKPTNSPEALTTNHKNTYTSAYISSLSYI
jgi:hypothetical protein